ncbi:MAG: hypothetical protein KME20_14015 [Kaiparowitsia implicata GSE-PSE-MK54-09C]|jgi:hypothetical protein|nr:hypothetical protein [Kaiparowitsia implicata GSE-PSE-MK54-09C]
MVLHNSYRTQADDTSVETDVFFFGLLRQRSALQRLLMGRSMMLDARRLSLCSLHQQFSDLTPTQFAVKVATAWLQDDCPFDFVPGGTDMSWIQDSTTLAVQLHRIFSTVSIPYYVTGGVAAIAYGEPRTTRGLDVVVAIAPHHIQPLVAALEARGFYVPGVDAVLNGQTTTLGITHIESISRADLMIAGSDAFAAIAFERIRHIQLPEGEALCFISPEDLVLNKIRWGAQSQSDKQWRDVLGILKVQADRLDQGYLMAWASRLGLIEEVQRALSEAGLV